MDKRRRSHDLDTFKTAFAKHRAITVSAAKSALSLGYGIDDVGVVVAQLEQRHFVKSTSGKYDHRQWQDVYNIRVGGLMLYIKFTDHIVTEFVLLSFKEK